MLVLPTIIFTLSAISGGSGLLLTAKSAIDTLEAASTNRYVQERNERSLLRFDACSQKLDVALTDLGKQRMTISKNFSVFINAFEKIHNRPEFSKGEDAEFPEFDFDEIKNISIVAGTVIGLSGGAVAGSALGAAAASGTTSAIMALGKASTGARIAGLSGAAKAKAALAALGGGAKAAGGGGIALGAMVLNAASLGVATLVEGIAMAYAGSVAKKEADKARDTLEKNEQIIQSAIDLQLDVTCSIDDIKKASISLCNNVYKKLVFQLKDLVAKKNDWNEYTDEEKALVENNILVVQILHYLNNIPVYKVTKQNEKGEPEEVVANVSEVNNAIKKAKKTAERMEL
jgi:hypothetical protein